MWNSQHGKAKLHVGGSQHELIIEIEIEACAKSKSTMLKALLQSIQNATYCIDGKTTKTAATKTDAKRGQNTVIRSRRWSMLCVLCDH